MSDDKSLAIRKDEVAISSDDEKLVIGREAKDPTGDRLKDGRRYLTTYLPGDIVHCRNKSVAMIKEAKCETRDSKGSVRHFPWNAPWDDSVRRLKEIGAVVREEYSVTVIPGFPCSKLEWYELWEFTEIAKGPLHDVLGGKSGVEKRDDPIPTPEDVDEARAKRALTSNVAPMGRPRVKSIRVRTNDWLE